MHNDSELKILFYIKSCELSVLNYAIRTVQIIYNIRYITYKVGAFIGKILINEQIM